MCLDDLVIIAKVSHPIPFRTRPLNPLALMVLRLKARESKSSPDLPNTLPPLFMFVVPPLSSSREDFLWTKYHQPDGTLASKLALGAYTLFARLVVPKSLQTIYAGVTAFFTFRSS